MKVKDLIDKLKTMDQDAVVIVASDNFELNGATVEVHYVHEHKGGSKENRIFRDAFDGETYDKEVYSISGGIMTVVLIA